MKKYVCLILFIFIIFSGCSKSVSLIYSPDKQHCISRFDITEEDGIIYTIFAYGNYSSNRMPNAYIKVRYRWKDAWYGLIKWNGANATFFYTYQDFEAINLDNSFLKMELMLSEQEFFSYFFDKISNDYIKVSSVLLNRKK